MGHEQPRVQGGLDAPVAVDDDRLQRDGLVRCLALPELGDVRRRAVLRASDPELGRLGPRVPGAGSRDDLRGRAAGCWRGVHREQDLYVGGHIRHDDDLGASHTFFNNSNAAVLRNDPLLEAIRFHDEAFGIQSGLSKGDFAKLRNVSLAFTLPAAWSSSFGASRAVLTLAAENVATLWQASEGTFGRRHTDPEIRNNTGNGLNVSNQEKLPPFTRLLMSLRVSM